MDLGSTRSLSPTPSHLTWQCPALIWPGTEWPCHCTCRVQPKRARLRAGKMQCTQEEQFCRYWSVLWKQIAHEWIDFKDLPWILIFTGDTLGLSGRLALGSDLVLQSQGWCHAKSPVCLLILDLRDSGCCVAFPVPVPETGMILPGKRRPDLQQHFTNTVCAFWLRREKGCRYCHQRFK